MTGIIIPDGGTIGSKSDTDAISIASDGHVTIDNLKKLKLVPQTKPSSPSEGEIYYDSSDNLIKYYDGNYWKTFHQIGYLLDPFNDDSQIAFWKFETNLNDEHGNYNLSHSNIAYRPGFKGNGMDSTDTNYASFSTFSGLTNFSVSFRLNADSIGANKYIFGNQSYGQLFEDNGVLKYYTVNQTNTYTGSPTIATGIDYHIVLSVSSSTPTLYLNNTSYASSSGTFTLHSGYIGTASTIPGHASYSFNGLIDEIRVFNKALTSGEVSILYTNDL